MAKQKGKAGKAAARDTAGEFNSTGLMGFTIPNGLLNLTDLSSLWLNSPAVSLDAARNMKGRPADSNLE